MQEVNWDDFSEEPQINWDEFSEEPSTSSKTKDFFTSDEDKPKSREEEQQGIFDRRRKEFRERQGGALRPGEKELLFGEGGDGDYENPIAPDHNTAKAVVNRTNELTSNFIQIVGESAQNFMYDSPKKSKRIGEYTDAINDFVYEKNQMDYKPTHTWEELKKGFKKGGVFDIDAWQEVGNFIAEQGTKSIADMGIMATAFPAYVASRTQEMAEEHAKNDKRSGKPTAKDYWAAAPFAIATSYFERLGLEATTKEVAKKVGKDLLTKSLKVTMRNIAKEVKKKTITAASTEGMTEFIQEGAIEPMGERIGTKSKDPLIDLERGLSGALVGVGTGGAVASTTATGAEAYYRSDYGKRKVIESEASNIIDSIEISLQQPLPEPHQNVGQNDISGVGEVIHPQVIQLPPNQKLKIVEQTAEAIEKTSTAMPDATPEEVSEIVHNVVVKLNTEEVGKRSPQREAGLQRAEAKRNQLEKEFGADEDAINAGMRVPQKKKTLPSLEDKYKGMSEEDFEQGQSSPIKKIIENIQAEKAFGEVESIETKSIKPIKTDKQIRQEKIHALRRKRDAEKAFGNIKQTETKSIRPKEAIETIPQKETRDNAVPESEKNVEVKKHEAQIVYDNLPTETKTVQGTQKGLDFEGTQNQLFDTESRTDFVVPKWASKLVSDTIRYQDIIEAVTEAKKGKHSDLSDRVAEAYFKANPKEDKSQDTTLSKETDSMIAVMQGTKNPPNYGKLYPLPNRPTNNKIEIGDKKVQMPNEYTSPQEIRDALTDLVGERFYQGNVKGKALGTFTNKRGEIRGQNLDDVAVVGHEVAHMIDYRWRTPEINSFMNDNATDIKRYSYTTNKDLELKEGFAELMRAYLTQSNHIRMSSPALFDIQNDLYIELDNALKSLGKKRYAKIKNIQKLSHFYYNQGSEMMTQSAISDVPTAVENIKDDLKKTLNKNMNITKFIDIVHPVKVMINDIGLISGFSAKNAYILFRLATGHFESVVEAIAKFGVPTIAKDGSLSFREGEELSLSHVFKPALKKGGRSGSNNKILNELYRYFQMKQALFQIQEQGKRTAFNYSDIIKEIPKLERNEGFVESWNRMMAFNENMLKFYVETSYITKDQAKAFKEANPYYIPTHRVVAGNESTGGGSGIKHRSKQGSERRYLPVDNIFAQIERHVANALLAYAKTTLLKQAMNNPNGATWVSRVKPRTERYNALITQQAAHFADVLIKEGMTISSDGAIVPADENNPMWSNVKEGMLSEMIERIKENPALATFYTSGQEPITRDSTVITANIDGKQQFFEINNGTENGKLLNEMFRGIDEHYESGKILKAMHHIKNTMTRSIVATPDFIIGNLFVDTTSAGLYSKTGGIYAKFIPGVSSAKGAVSVAKEDADFQLFLLNGGAFGTRVEMSTQENRKRQLMKMSVDERSLGRFFNKYDRFISVGEMATRTQEYRDAVSEGVDPLAAAFMGVEITTDFNMHGSNKYFNAIRSTVAFLPASINSIYKDYRELSGNESSVMGIAGSNFAKLAARGFTYITIPALISMMLDDDDEEKERPVPSEAMYSHYEVGKLLQSIGIDVDDDFALKHKTQYLLGMIFEKAPKMAREAFIKDNGERAWEIAKASAWIMLTPDITPTMASPFVDISINRRFTGAPVVPRRLQKFKGDQKYLQKTFNTPLIYVKTAELLKEVGINASPLEIQHINKSWFGYVAKWIEDGTSWALWNEKEYGEKPYSGAANLFKRHFVHQFYYKDYGQTYWSKKYYDLRDKASSLVSVEAEAKKLYAAGRDKEADKMLKDNPVQKGKAAMKQLMRMDKIIGNIRKQEKAIQYNKGLSMEEKEKQLKKLHKEIGRIQHDAYENLGDILKRNRDE